jgi:signal transduction histidine kinase/ActR/RegA family two-component response regulator
LDFPRGVRGRALARTRERASRVLDGGIAVFAALSVALAALGVRFYCSSDFGAVDEPWRPDEPRTLTALMLYQAAKAVFAARLAEVACVISGRPVSRFVLVATPALMVGLGLTPLLSTDVTRLVAWQSPWIVCCAVAGFRALSGAAADETGRRIVRFGLGAMAVTWSIHAAGGFAYWHVRGLATFFTVNSSYVDLGIHVALGAGILATTLQDARRKLRESEAEQERLRREVERDDRLRALGTLVSGVAHELNNPLTAVLGYADELVETGQGGDAAVVIREQAERCRAIVRDLSALARPGRHARESLDAAELLARVARGLAKQCEAHGVATRLRAEPGVALFAERAACEQVLTKLVANAAEASPAGGVVTVEVRSTAEGGAIVEVADQGPGVPLESRARIFEPFYTTKAPGKGTGLGLAVAHALVRGHGGSLTVDDAPGGRGALFRATFPPSYEADPPSGRERHLVRIDEKGPPLAVMVIDDDAAVRAIVTRFGERRGWRVVEVGSAEEAWARLVRGETYDVLLCDLRMPGLGGVGFERKLAAERPQDLARTIFFSGDLASANVAEFAARTARPLIPKPFRPATMIAAVEEVARAAATSPPKAGAAER